MSLKALLCTVFLVGLLASPAAAQDKGAKKGAPSPPAPIVVRLEPTAPVTVQLPPSPPPSSPPPVWTYWLPSVMALLGVLLGLWINQRNSTKTLTVTQANSAESVGAALRANQATNWQKANENELNTIQDKLEKFYGPLMTRLQADHLLAQDIRNRQPEGFRLLRNLFNREWLAALSEGDRKLVAMICVEHAGRLEEMIITAGSVEPLLIPYFSRAVAHFRILKLAHEGALGNDFTPFERYVYPRPLDKVLILEFKRLTARLDEIRRKPTAQLSAIRPLIIPDEEKYRLPLWPDPDGRILQNEKWLDLM